MAEAILGLELAASGDTSWYASYQEAREILGLVNAPDGVYRSIACHSIRRTCRVSLMRPIAVTSIRSRTLSMRLR